MSLRVLITNLALEGRTGTDIVVRDLAAGLSRSGSDVSVYSPRLGPMAEEIRSLRIAVSDDLTSLKAPDIVHGHHHVETAEALLHFPEARGLFVCHDYSAWHDRPPDLTRLLRYVAVDACVRERLEAYAFVRDRGISAIPNAVDTQRFQMRPPLPGKPSRALVFSNYSRPGYDFDLLRAACDEMSIALETAGERLGTQTATPETLLPRYDIVFAKARCAMEAAASGCYVVLYHDGMLGPSLDGTNIKECLRWNLGRRLFTERLTPETLRQRLGQYNARAALDVCGEVRRTNSLDAVLPRWLALYDELMTQPLPPYDPRERRFWISGLVRRVEDLETTARRVASPKLPAAVACELRLELLYAPFRVRCGASFALRVRVHNRSLHHLIEAEPHPMRIGCLWVKDGHTREAARRGYLQQGIQPESMGECELEQIAPAVPGEYTLRISLVQEQVRWLHHVKGGPVIDLRMQVVED